MKNKLIRILPLVLLAAGCTREMMDPLAENRSRAVDFQFSTHYTQEGLLTKASDNLFDTSATKTVFSGKDQNGQDVTSSSTKERIDWEVGDKVDLMVYKGDQEYKHTYEIKAFKTEGNLESQSTSVSSDESFTFKGGGDYYFFATYPSRSIGKALKKGNGYDYGLWKNGPTSAGFGLHMPNNLTCSITEKNGRYVVMDDMDYAVMTAGKFVSNMTSPQSIEMELTPFFNAYQLILTNTEATASYKLEKLTISCTDGYLRTQAGADKRMPSTIRFSGGKVETIGNDGYNNGIKTITYDFTQVSGFSQGIPFNKPLDITLLALPLAQKGLSFTFTFNGGITRTLTLDPSVTLAPSHKMRIYNIGEGSEWIYVLDVEPVARFDKNDVSASSRTTAYKVKSSYRYKEGDESTWEPVKWATEINLGARDINANKDWRRISAYSAVNSDKPGWITFTNTGLGNGGKNTEPRSITASQYFRHVNSNNPDEFFKDAISGNIHPSRINNLSDKANAIDLSMYDLGGNPISMTSANCYVVSAPGWYKFPLVYGNTLKNGSHNMGAVQSYHVRHDGGAIGQPWIRASLGGDLVNDYTAALVWQDNKPECSYVGCNNRSHGVIDKDKLEVRMDNGMAYMYFYVPQHSIQPGNNLLALKKGGDIVWSWHIWITDQPLEPKDDRYLSAYIGWTPLNLSGGNNGIDVYPARSEVLKIIQVTADGQKIPEGQEKEILVIQEGTTKQILFSDRVYRFGRSVYFQYGRKDPMFPALSTGGNIKTQEIYDDAADGNLTPLAGNDGYMPVYGGEKSVPHSIKNPAVFYTTNTPFAQHVGGYWRTDLKTVYDPSPIGYRVIDSFDGAFKSSYQNSSLTKYMIVPGNTYPGAYVGNRENLFLPVVGQRVGLSSLLHGCPADRTSFGEGANDAKAMLWAADGHVFSVELGLRYSYKGYVNLGNGWSYSGQEADGYPVLCIVE